MIAGATGVARYVTELDRALVDAGVELRRYAIGRAPRAAPPGTQRLRLPLKVVRPFWRVVRLPRIEHLVGRVDVVHVTDLVPPPTRYPLVLTVHDLDAIDLPALHSRRARQTQRQQLAAARDRVDAVIADSAATASRLEAHGVDPTKITVVHLGLTRLPPADLTRVPDDRYLLAVGSLDARKGLDVLIRAFADSRLSGLRLVIAGVDGHRGEEVRAAVAASGARDRVILAGRVTDAQLAGLYEGAVAFCLPSRAEGFGLPVLEAMASGTPVVVSDLPVTREVAGDAAAFVPIDDVGAWVDTLERVSADAARRSAMAAAGRSVAAGFTWSAAAAATRAVYERVAAQHGSRP